MDVRPVTAAVAVELLGLDAVVVDQVLLDLVLIAKAEITFGALVNAHAVSVRP